MPERVPQGPQVHGASLPQDCLPWFWSSTESAPQEWVARGQIPEGRRKERGGGLPTDLVDGQIDARVGNDAQHVGQVAMVEGTGPFSFHDPPCTVQQSLVLARPAKGQPCL